MKTDLYRAVFRSSLVVMLAAVATGSEGAVKRPSWHSELGEARALIGVVERAALAGNMDCGIMVRDAEEILQRVSVLPDLLARGEARVLLARLRGLQGDFAAGHDILDENARLWQAVMPDRGGGWSVRQLTQMAYYCLALTTMERGLVYLRQKDKEKGRKLAIDAWKYLLKASSECPDSPIHEKAVLLLAEWRDIVVFGLPEHKRDLEDQAVVLRLFLHRTDRIEFVFRLPRCGVTGYQPAVCAQIGDKATIARMVSSLELTPKGKCLCSPGRSAVFHVGDEQLHVLLNDHCFYVNWHGTLLRYRMPDAFWKEFCELSRRAGIDDLGP